MEGRYDAKNAVFGSDFETEAGEFALFCGKSLDKRRAVCYNKGSPDGEKSIASPDGSKDELSNRKEIYIMKRNNKKGFTIVELVIVIAAIAILTAVLIPTFSNVIKRANESNAMQMAKTEYELYLSEYADKEELEENLYIKATWKGTNYWFEVNDRQFNATKLEQAPTIAAGAEDLSAKKVILSFKTETTSPAKPTGVTTVYSDKKCTTEFSGDVVASTTYYYFGDNDVIEDQNPDVAIYAK